MNVCFNDDIYQFKKSMNVKIKVGMNVCFNDDIYQF